MRTREVVGQRPGPGMPKEQGDPVGSVFDFEAVGVLLCHIFPLIYNMVIMCTYLCLIRTSNFARMTKFALALVFD